MTEPAQPSPGSPYAQGPYGQPPYDPQGPSPRRALGCMVLVISALMAVFFGMCLLSSLLTSASGGSGSVNEEKVIGSGDAKIALISLQGVIMRKVGGGTFWGGGYDLVERLQSEFDRAAKDDAVKAVLLEVDSPGGAVTTSDQLWHMIKTFRAETKKPVVVHMGGVAASGGYYVSVAADAIYCEPTTITGSIGVILSMLNFHDLMKKYGVQDVTITSGPNKALLSQTGEVKEQHKKILQGMVNDAYARFTKLVADGRSLPLETVKKLADGRIYTAKQALDLKLVDGIGYLKDSFEQAKKLAGAGEARLVRYKHQQTFADLLSNARAPRIDLESFERFNGPQLLALWRGR